MKQLLMPTPKASDAAVLQRIISAGKLSEPNFNLDTEADKKHYLRLFRYFNKESDTDDTSRGLFIAGSVGTGKTLSMKIMQRLFPRFGIVSCRHVIREFMQEKFTVIDRYGRYSFKTNAVGKPRRSEPIAFCFDDISLEQTHSNLYGNQANIMQDIILDRYDCFRDYGMLTHFTTNANSKIIEDNYGIRVRDRLREMCNLIIYEGQTKRK